MGKSAYERKLERTLFQRNREIDHLYSLIDKCSCRFEWMLRADTGIWEHPSGCWDASVMSSDGEIMIDAHGTSAKEAIDKAIEVEEDLEVENGKKAE